jgi:hypothetical protein
MAGLGIGIAWFGYSVFYYGVTQIQGGNWGLLDLMLPSRWAAAAATPKDDGTTAAAAPVKAPPAVTGTAQQRGTKNAKFPTGIPSPAVPATPIK